MPIEIAPERIDQSDLSGGWSPDGGEAAVPMNASPDMLNLLPAPSGNELQVRCGFTRLPLTDWTSTMSGVTGEHWIRHLNYYETIYDHDRLRYLIAVLQDGTDGAADNVQVWAYNLSTNAMTRVDTPGRSWTRGDTEHWHAVVEGTYYGGTLGERPYSWHPTFGWEADPTLPTTVGTWVDSISPGGSEVARDYAFRRRQKVLYSGDYYKPAKDIRYKTWETGERYAKNEKVSRKVDIGGETYWRSYECIEAHTAGSDNDEPGTGANTATYWRKIRLSAIKDADGDVTDDWLYLPRAAKGMVGAYHSFRLFLRASDGDNWARVQYSAPAKPERHAEIADLDFDPTDWAVNASIDGEGGGWFTVPFQGKGDAVRAMVSFGNYLIIAGRWQSYVLAGPDEEQWVLRLLGDYGAVGPQAMCELNGLVYMLGRHGMLARTDGTNIEPVPGSEYIRRWLKAQLDDSMGTTYNWYPSLLAHDGKLFISLPDPSGTDYLIVYDPATEAFYPLDIPVLSMTTGELGGVSRLWFSTTIKGTTGQVPCIFQYKDDPGSEVYTDDDDECLTHPASTLDITWYYRSAWFQFGSSRQERRVRRAWVKVKCASAISWVVRLYKNFETTYYTTATRTGLQQDEGEYAEAQVGTNDAYAVGIRVGGTTNKLTSVHGFGIDTEYRRSRFHT